MNLIPFAAQARNQFDRVAQKYGLSRVTADEQRVRYENDRVFLEINFDNGRSYELGVRIGRKVPNQVERPFSFAEILRLRNIPAAATVEGLTVENGDELHDRLRMLADLTLQYADDFLRGDYLSFAQVAELRQKESSEYAIQRDLRSARARAELAWKANNYAGVVSALEPLSAHLSPADVGRLEYSKGKVKS
jgi:hypothetical protein